MNRFSLLLTLSALCMVTCYLLLQLDLILSRL